jgi:hypothetical protein
VSTSAATRVRILPAPTAISGAPRLPPPLPEFLPDRGGVEQLQPVGDGPGQSDLKFAGDLGHVLTLATTIIKEHWAQSGGTISITPGGAYRRLDLPAKDRLG